MGLTNQIGASSIIKSGVCTSTTRPASPYIGQGIYETDTLLTKYWNGSSWALVNTGYVICTSSTRPASPFAGQAIYETDTNRFNVYDGAAWSPPITQEMLVEDQKGYLVDGGTFTAGGAWRTRDLNTVRYNTITGASLASNAVTLPAGKYFFQWSAPAFNVNQHITALYQTSGTPAILIFGSSEFSAGYAQSRSVGNGYYTFTSTQSVIIWHQCTLTKTTDGFGTNAQGMSSTNIYSSLYIRKIS